VDARICDPIVEVRHGLGALHWGYLSERGMDWIDPTKVFRQPGRALLRDVHEAGQARPGQNRQLSWTANGAESHLGERVGATQGVIEGVQKGVDCCTPGGKRSTAGQQESVPNRSKRTLTGVPSFPGGGSKGGSSCVGSRFFSPQAEPED